jgi:hypothetical protein
VQQEAETGRRGDEQGQARCRGGDQAGTGPADGHHDQQGDDGQDQAGEDVPDS